TRYSFREDRMALLEKIQRAASAANRIYLAMDDDQEGDVIAYDMAWVLAEHSEKLFRVRLRALSESEMRAAFNVDLSRDFKQAAHNGMCRRIVDRAIGATFSRAGEGDEHIPVGRVQSSLLASLEGDPPEVGSYTLAVKNPSGGDYVATVPIRTQDDLERLESLAKLVTGRTWDDFGVRELMEVEEQVGSPWGYEDVIEAACLRLDMGVTEAAAA